MRTTAQPPNREHVQQIPSTSQDQPQLPHEIVRRDALVHADGVAWPNDAVTGLGTLSHCNSDAVRRSCGRSALIAGSTLVFHLHCVVSTLMVKGHPCAMNTLFQKLSATAHANDD